MGALPQERRTGWLTLDIVIPMYNEAKVLPVLLDVLATTFSAAVCEQHRISKVTCLFVDDGSSDESVQIVQATRVAALHTGIIRLSRNFGHQAAVTAGIATASGDLVAVMDADLQDPPGCILEMIEKWRQGFEVVFAVRRNRKEGPVKVALYWTFYRVYRLLTPIPVPTDSGDFCLMSRRVVDELNRLPEKVRFARGLRSWIGFRQTAVAYDRPARAAGESRYGMAALYQLATEGIASLSLRPLQLAQLLSILYLSLTVGAVPAMMLGLFDSADLNTRLSIVLVLMLLSNSIILFCLYIIGAYLGRAYLEVKGRPSYVVADVLWSDTPGHS